LDKDGLRFVRGMVQASQEMNRMIDNLLILSRLKRGVMQRESVDLVLWQKRSSEVCKKKTRSERSNSQRQSTPWLLPMPG
jgi:hypothetical protein